MSKRRRRSSSKGRSNDSSMSRSKRGGFQTAVETLMGVGAAILLVAVAYWWFFVRPSGESLIPEESNYAQEAVSGNVIENESAYSTIVESNDLESLQRLTVELDNWKRDASFTVKLDTLSRRIEVANLVLKHQDTDEKLRVATATKLLTAYGQFYGISVEEDLGENEVVGKYLNACNDYINDENEDLAKFAKMSKAKVQVFESTREGADKSTISIQQTISDLIASYPEDPEVLLTARQLIARVGMADVRTAAKISRDVLDGYGQVQPKNENVLRQLRSMKDKVLLEDSQVAYVFRDAQSSGDFEPYFEKVDELLQDKDTGIGFLNRIYESIQYFEGQERHDLALKVIEKMEQGWQGRTDVQAREHAFRIGKFGRIRNESVGTKIDLNDIQSNGKPINTNLLDGKPCIIAFYSPNSPASEEMFNNLKFTYQLLLKTNVRVIAIAVEPERDQSFIEAFDPSWISINSSIENTSKIFKQCPPSHVPYFAVLNGDAVVDSIGVPAGRLKTKIETIFSNQKVSTSATGR